MKSVAGNPAHKETVPVFEFHGYSGIRVNNGLVRRCGRYFQTLNGRELSPAMDAGQASALYLRLMSMQTAGKFDSSWTEAKPFARMVNETLKPAAAK